MIPNDVINDILDKVNIVEVISSYIPLKQAGRNLRANCPFHHEKTPSFMVSADKQIYHCFGCGAGGSALTFLMQYEKMDFPEAIETLAKKAGVALSHAPDKTISQESGAREKLYKINELASVFYHKNLLMQEAAKQAREYLNKRGISQKIAQDMRLGFAVDKWDALLAHLKERGINPGLANQLGLIIPNDKGGFYDRFRNRVIFPISDVKSNIIGFGGRVLDDGIPKYVNSPETLLYVKGRHLYGLNLSKNKIREADCCLVVEGYMDFLMPFTAGIDNIVASLGTALTKEQIRLIKRHTHNVVMIYDSDFAGEAATLRSLDLFIEEGVNVKIVTLDEGYDPDLFVRKFGAPALRDKIANAQNLFDYKLKFLKTRHNAAEAEGKAGIIADMLVSLNKFDNAVIKAHYLKKLSEGLSVPEAAIATEMNKIKKPASSDDPAAAVKNRLKDIALRDSGTLAFEKLLVKLMLQEESLIHRMKDAVSAADFRDENLSKIVRTMFELAHSGKSVTPHKLLHHFSSPEVSSLISELTATEEVLSHKEKAIEECLGRLKKESMLTKRRNLSLDIKRAQETNNQEQLGSLLREFNTLIKMR